MSDIKQSGKIVTQYLSAYPAMASRTLARLIFKENKGVWNNMETIRKRIGYYRQQAGDKYRRIISPTHAQHKAKSGDSRRSTDKKYSISSKCRILIFDIETSPQLSLPWGCLKQFINPEQLLGASKVLCWSARWLDEKKVHYMQMDIPDKGGLPDDPMAALQRLAKFYTYSDYDVCEGLWLLFDDADIVVAHNGKAFDTAHMNTRWLDHGFLPPSPYKIIDTLLTARKQFNFPRSKLESICRYRNIGKKTDHEGFELWKKCMCGDKDAWARMKKYNINDVKVLAGVYLDMRPWMLQHPNVALSYEDGLARCTACGAAALTELTKTAKTAASIFDSYRCDACGKIMRSRKRIKPTGEIRDRMANVY